MRCLTISDKTENPPKKDSRIMNMQFAIYIKNIKVKDGCMSAILNLIKLKFCRAYPSGKLHILFFCNDLAICHCFPNIKHINVNNGCKSEILNLIEWNIFKVYPFLKLHICFIVFI